MFSQPSSLSPASPRQVSGTLWMDDVLRHTVAGLMMTPRYSRPSLSSSVDAAKEDNCSMEAEMQRLILRDR